MNYQDPRAARQPQQGPMAPPPPGRYGPPPGSYPPQGPAPGAPWHAHTPPGTPPPGGSRGRRTAVTAIIATVLVAAAGGVWLWTSGGGGDSDEPDTPVAREYDAAAESLGVAEVAWQVEQGEAPEAVGVDFHWVTDEHLVRRLPGRVVAYELKTGKEAWESPVGTVEDARCGSSLEHSNLRVALLVSTGTGVSHACEKLVVLDIGTGKEVATADLPPIGSTKVGAAVPVVFGENVIIPSGAGTRVLDINTGAVRSMPNPQASCTSTDVALFGDLLLAEATCSEDRTTTERLRAFNANLELTWEWTTPKGDDGQPLEIVGVASLDPLVVELSSSEKTQLLRVDPTSGNTVTINDYDGQALREGYMKACDGTSLACDLARVSDNKLILMTIWDQVNPDTPEASPGAQSTEFRNELVAFDLDTGKEAWRTGMVPGRLLGLVPALPEAGVVAYQPSNLNGTKGMVFSVDPASGKLEPLMPIGPKAHETEPLNNHIMGFNFAADNHAAVWRDGLFLVFKSTHRTATRGEPDTVAFTLSK